MGRATSEGKMEPKYPEGGHCQSVLRPQGIFDAPPPLFLIIQWRRQRHLTWSATHNVVSREINPQKSFDLLLGSNFRSGMTTSVRITLLRNCIAQSYLIFL